MTPAEAAPVLGSWPIILLILGVGYILGRVRPLRELVHRLKTNHLNRSAERLARRDRMWEAWDR